MIKLKLPDKYLYFPTLILIAYFIVRLVNQLQLMWIFPLDSTNDWVSHMAQLYFLAKVGFHNLSPYWYNGYILFKLYPPGWFFFTLPIYLLTKNILFSTYFSVLVLFLIAFLFINYFFKKLKISFIKRLFFYVIFFANPISIGNFVRLGKVTELIAWVLFLPLASIILIYKDKPLNFKALFFFTLFLTLLIISHPTVLIVFLLLVFSLLLVKNLKEKIKIILSLIVSALLSSFWLIPFLKSFSSSLTLAHEQTSTLLSFSGPWFKTAIATIAVIILFWAVFLLYIKQAENKKKEFLFHFPLIILSILVISKLVAYIPFLRNVYPDVYILLFLFILSYLFLKIKYSSKVSKLIFGLLIILSLSSVVISSISTPWFTHHTDMGYQTLSLLPNIKDKFLIIPHPKIADTSYTCAYYSYVPIYYNISTSEGWSHHEVNADYLELLNKTQSSFKNNDCYMFKYYLQKINTTNILGFFEDCNALMQCGFEEINSTKDACLVELN